MARQSASAPGAARPQEAEGRIRVLSDELANQIAAGAVVERPAAVVKELVENSLDAGATRVFVDIEDGGQALIRITDDGSGMSRQDAERAILRHATSKIRHVDDLFNITTLGFRGEALPSIASVSRMTLKTCEPGDIGGTEILIEGGRVLHVKDAGMPDGTIIEVRDLFYNTPARLKFLKTTPTETRHISESLLSLALSRYNIHLRLTHNGRQLFDLPANSSLGDRLLAVLGREVRQALFETADYPPIDGVRAHGYFSRPDVSQRGTQGYYIYVNGRFIKERTIHAAVKAAYRGMIDKSRYPTVVLFIDMPPDLVDVNVHPTKVEVRFRNTDAIFRAVYHAINDALQETPWVKDEVRTYKLTSEQQVGHRALGPEQATYEPLNARHTILAGPAAQSALALGAHRAPAEPLRIPMADLFGPPSPAPARPDAPAGRAAEVAARPAATPGRTIDIVDPEAEARARIVRAEAEGYFSRLHFIGQYKRNYLVCSDASGLVIVDQQAAHERITFENLKALYHASDHETQPLLFPLRINLDTLRAAAMEEFLDFFLELGFEIEPFGGNDYALKAVPAILTRARHEPLIKDALDDLSSVGRSDRIHEAVDAILLRMACHGSIRSGDDTGPEEATALFRQLDAIDFGSNCPHGRPVYFRLPLAELEAAFGR